MELRATFQIPLLIKALTDVVVPAVDPDNKLAQEQAQLVVASLNLIAQRLPLQYRYDRHELDSFVALAAVLEEEAGEGAELADVLDGLRQSARHGQEVLARAGAEPAELEQANNALRNAVGRLIQTAVTLQDDARRAALDRAVMAHAKDMLLRERTFLAAQGWEGKNAELPALDDLLKG